MDTYEITECSLERLKEGKSDCYKAKIFADGKYDDWIWITLEEVIKTIREGLCTVTFDEHTYLHYFLETDESLKGALVIEKNGRTKYANKWHIYY